MRDNLNLPIALLADCNCVTQISNAIVNLDFIMEELLECIDVKDLVGGRLGGVNNELQRLAVGSVSNRAVSKGV